MKQIIILMYALSVFQYTLNAQELDERIKDSIKFELCKIWATDQTMRHELIEEAPKIMRKIDSLNYESFLSIVRKYGFPSSKKLGSIEKCDCLQAGVVILLHNPKKIVQKETFELLYSEMKKGNLNSILFANALDKYYILYEGYSLYGAIPKLKKPLIKDFELVNCKRMELDLSPLGKECFEEQNIKGDVENLKE
jgi:hypothetical protein